jgi:hypothetical protein
MRFLRYSVALALVLSACSGAGAETTTTSTTIEDPTTTAEATPTTEATTTTVDDRPRSPVNGLPIDDAETLDRRVLAVKIDNHWNARPQSGILEADAVFEIRVEGGLTRFMAVFHSSDSEMLGPIRSGRPSDAAIVRPLEAVLTISGGQPWVQAGIRALGVNLIGDSRPGMFRVSGRSAPHNLYGNTIELRGVADSRELPDTPPPVAIWDFGELPTTGEEASEATFTFSDTTTTVWTWDGTTYYRTIDGVDSNWVTPDEEVERINADVLVAIVGEYYTASPPGGSSGSSVPATSTVGTGDVYVFADGKVVSGTWEREDAADPFVFTTADGEPLLVPPGRPWISIVPDTGEVGFDNPPVTTTTTAPSTSTTTGG